MAKKDTGRLESGPIVEGQGDWLTAPEAADRLGVTRRHFQKLIAANPIEFKLDGPRKLYSGAALDELIVEDNSDEQQTAMSALMREVARASKEVHGSAALALDSAAKSIEGTNARTGKLLKALLRENKRLSRQCENHEKEKLAIWELFKGMNEAYVAELHAAARRERERMVGEQRDQVIHEGFKLALPGLIHRLAPSKTTEQTIIGQAYEHLTDEGKAALMGVITTLPEGLQASVTALVADGIEGERKKKAAESK